MSDLEQHSKPFLLPMIENRGAPTLGPRDARTVATWAIKTALVAGSRFEPAIPRQFYTEFYEAQAPVGKVRVWIGRTPHLQTHTIDFRGITVCQGREGPTVGGNGYQAVLSVGHLALYVVGWRGAKPPLDRVFSEFGDTALVKLWPYQPPITWPPPKTITLPGLEALADRLAGIPDASTSARPAAIAAG